MSQKNPNPVEIYWQKARLEPAAPVTLWLFPDLKLLADSKQRTALAEAWQAARNYWLIRVFRYAVVIVAMLGIWAASTEPVHWLAPYHRALPMLVLASPVIEYFLARARLRSAIQSSTAGMP